MQGKMGNVLGNRLHSHSLLLGWYWTNLPCDGILPVTLEIRTRSPTIEEEGIVMNFYLELLSMSVL